MATLQPLAKGQSVSPTATKAFSQLLAQLADSPIPMRPTTRCKGEVAVVFSKEDANKLAAPFRLALVGKFSHDRPNLEEIQKFFFYVKPEGSYFYWSNGL